MQYLSLTLPGGNITPPSVIKQQGINDLNTILSNAITVFIVIGLGFVAIYLVWGGMQWITSQGDKAKVTAARGRITWAIIGFILLLLSVAIVKTLGFFFHIDLLQLKA